MKKNLLTLTLLLLISCIVMYKAYADEIESKFKKVCYLLAKESAETVAPTGPEYAVSDKVREETFARQKKLFQEWQNELRDLIKQDPKSIWADDAQYIISVLSVENKPRQTEELESLLKEYPDFHIEDWTKNNLSLLIPSNISPYLARLELCMLYKEMGDSEKLKISCEEGIKAYPENAEKFEKILRFFKTNQTN